MNMELLKKTYVLSVSFMVTFLVAVTSVDLSAAHIVGGDITYRCLGQNGNMRTIEFTFTMYRDDTGGGAGFDMNAKFGIFSRLTGGTWQYVAERLADPRGETFIDIIESDPCVEVVSQIVIERATYTFQIDLPVINGNYMVAYQRCCRNDNIDNIVNSGEAGAAFTLEITPAAMNDCNSSPTLNFPPPNIICANFPVTYDNSATDPEGDEIVYSFCTPRSAGGTGEGNLENTCEGVRPDPDICPPPYDQVTYAVGYSGAFPILGNPPLSINASTGIVTGQPDALGLYVVGVCIEEFSGGVLYSTIRSDYQITVGVCNSLVAIEAETNSEFNGETGILSEPQVFMSNDEFLFANSCGDLTVDFGCEVCVDLFPDSRVRWELFLPGNDTIKSTDKFFTGEFPDYDTYQGIFYFQQEDDSSGCNDTLAITVDIFPPSFPDFDLVFDTCGYDPIMLLDASTSTLNNIANTRWYLNNELIGENITEYSFLPEMLGELNFRLELEDTNGCLFVKREQIDYFPTDNIDFEISNFIACEPATISFGSVLDLITEDYDAIWDFGDGSPPVNNIAPTHTYVDTGVFTVSLQLISPTGCEESETFPNWISVRPSPEADFTFTPEDPSIFDREVSFFDQSIDAVSWQWNFDGFGTSLFQNPTYTFPDTGIYTVRLVVTHPTSGCPDTTYRIIDISPEIKIYFPNAFTPNNDAKNDEFKPVGFFSDVSNYHFRIWNRWGEMIYESTDPESAWNGRSNNNGELSPDGVYVYTVDFVSPRGTVEEYRGHVTLLR